MGIVEEKVTEWVVGEAMTLAVHSKKKGPPFQTASGRLTLRLSGNDTVVSFFITYELKYGLLGSLLDAVMVRPFMRRAAPKMLLGLKHYAETGELVTPQAVQASEGEGVPAELSRPYHGVICRPIAPAEGRARLSEWFVPDSQG